MELSIEQYIATNNPLAANNFVVKHGLKRPKNHLELVKKINYILKNKGKDAFVELSEIDTPYKRLVSDFKETKSNACGCSGVSSADGEEQSNCSGCPKYDNKSSADGDDNKTTPAVNKTSDNQSVKVLTPETAFKKYAPLATVVLLGGILVALIAKK
jgi:hypothetical protein